MRLIHASTYQIHFFEERLPITTAGRYAILSHTWGAIETSFKQFQKLLLSAKLISANVGPNRTGLWKIQMACQQALADGFEYVWVDTCCIDKTSSAELSEAINSMFRWYQNATVCYAYLDDIEAEHSSERRFDTTTMLLPSETHSLGGSGSISVDQMSRARWFSRGWTLQELIAPKQVRFYDKKWCLVGTKQSLEPLLSHVTGIDGRTLRGASLAQTSVARRMSWAARRITTKIEDMAYCLLGIFGVNMTMQYGEGMKSFVRLQEEIMKDSSDQSLFA